MESAEEEIIVTGGLLSITLFEEKLMKNFFIINNRLKKLEALTDLQTKTRNIEKELKFLTVKVDSVVEKLPKDGHSMSKKDVQTTVKDQVFEMLNNSEDKLKQTQTFASILSQIQKVKFESKGGHQRGQGSVTGLSNNSASGTSKPTSFTAGSVLLEAKKSSEPSKQLLNEVLNKQENKIVESIINEQKSKELPQYSSETSQICSLRKQIEKLYEIIEGMKVGRGFQSFVEKEVNHYDKFESNEKPEFKQSMRRSKQLHHRESDRESEGLSKVKPGFNKNQLGEDKGGKTDIIQQQDLVARKTFTSKNPTTLLTKEELSVAVAKEKSKHGELTKVEYIPENKLLSKAQRSKSLRALERVEKKLRVDDIKDLNTVLKQIEFRLEGRVSREVFSNYAMEFEEKLEILRITKDPTSELNDIRKMIFGLQSKLQHIVNYLQNTINEDDALIVKKAWTCISCDKMVEKFNAKTGQHLNWDSVNSKKMSPSKVGAFGQTGQLASKIKNLMDYQGE